MTKTAARGATLGLDLTEDWKRDNYGAAPRVPRLEWRELEAAIDARHAALATVCAERETTEAEAAARRAALEDAANAYNAAAEDGEDAISADGMAEALEAERDALELSRVARMEADAERADGVQEFTVHTSGAAPARRVTLEAARRSASYQAASVMLAAAPRLTNVMLASRYDSLTVQIFTLEAMPAPSSILPRLRLSERAEARAVASWEAIADKAEAEARISQWNKPSRGTASSLEAAQKTARDATRATYSLRRDYSEASAAPRYAFRAVLIASLEVPANFNTAELIRRADEITRALPARSDIHPLPTKLGRGNVTGTTQATKPGTRLVLAERGRRVVDIFDAAAEAKREARRARDARRTGQTVKNRHAARLAALSDFQSGLELLETARGYADAARVADERRAEDKARRAASARERRARETAEDKAARNMALKIKRRAAKQK